MENPLILASNLSFSYGLVSSVCKPLWEPLNFSIKAGEVVGLKGSNGSGKTTLLKILAGLLSPSFGFLRLSPVLQGAKIYIPAGGLGLNWQLSAHENWMTDFCIQNRMKASMQQVKKLAQGFSLGLHSMRRPLYQLSAGQRQKILLIKLILSGADCWLLDEPFNGLDQASCSFFLQVLKDHQTMNGTSIISQHGLFSPGMELPMLIYDQVIELCTSLV